MEEYFLKNQDMIIQQIINSTAIKIAKLHEQANIINQQIEQYQEAA